MPRTLSKSAVLLASAVLILTNLSSAGTGAQKRKAAAKTDQTPPAAQLLVPVPLQAPTPEQMPAQPPQVTFHNGLLAISADNSNLADVLRGVRNALGIGLDTPPGAGSERVVVHLGPGQPRDVLTQLFSGSRYDYILVGTAQDPQGVSQVILTPRQSTTVAGNVGQPSAPQPAIGGVSTGDDADSTDTEDTAQQSEPTAAPQLPPSNPYQPNTPPPAGNSASSGGETGGQQVKTPEQLLQELQRMQQQQQQQQPNRPQ
jgi:hypothetical protein